MFLIKKIFVLWKITSHSWNTIDILQISITKKKKCKLPTTEGGRLVIIGLTLKWFGSRGPKFKSRNGKHLEKKTSYPQLNGYITMSFFIPYCVGEY